MSARVINPMMLTEFYKISSPNVMRKNLSSTNRKLNTIKKDLFGTPNSNETKKIIENELEKHQDLACKKWSFDFRNGYPIVTKNSQFIWERVTFPDFVPEMYTLTNAAHVRDIGRPSKLNFDDATYEITSEDLLMDERAARENSESPLRRRKLNHSLNGSSSDDFTEDEEHQQEAIAVNVPIEKQNEFVISAYNSLRKKRRQPKITEFMKERKRLAPTPKKLSPIKRMRMTPKSMDTLKVGTPNLNKNTLFSKRTF